MLKQERSSFSQLQSFDAKFSAESGIVAGIDEAGRGPFAGPVVAAACFLPSSFFCSYLNDSKKLSEIQRETAYLALISDPAVVFSVAVVNAATIDQLGIHKASLFAMHKAALRLKKSVDLWLIDGPHIPDGLQSCKGIVQGDSKSAAIAAASIIAKYRRDWIMKKLAKLYPYGFDKHKGYGTRMHKQALAAYGPSSIHRKSFAPIKSLIENASFSQ